LIVDTGRGGQLRINMNITFRHMPCNVLSLDAMDISGEHQLDILHTIFKRRLDENGVPKAAAERDENIHSNKSVVRAQVKQVKDGKEGKTLDTGHAEETEAVAPAPAADEKECGSCYGAETISGQCCNTCDEVREAYRSKGWAFAFAMHITQCQKEGFMSQLDEQKGEGCEVAGHLIVNKVAGNYIAASDNAAAAYPLQATSTLPPESRFNKAVFTYCTPPLTSQLLSCIDLTRVRCTTSCLSMSLGAQRALLLLSEIVTHWQLQHQSRDQLAVLWRTFSRPS
jgi:hypothetical protein